MKGRYNFTQIVHTGPQKSVPVKVKHDYEGAVPLKAAERVTNYLGQNPGRGVTVRQRRQIRRGLTRTACGHRSMRLAAA